MGVLTMWDAAFDPRVRQAVARLPEVNPVELCQGLAAAGCETLQAAKQLQMTSACLASLPETVRESFLRTVRSIKNTGPYCHFSALRASQRIMRPVYN